MPSQGFCAQILPEAPAKRPAQRSCAQILSRDPSRDLGQRSYKNPKTLEEASPVVRCHHTIHSSISCFSQYVWGLLPATKKKANHFVSVRLGGPNPTGTDPMSPQPVFPPAAFTIYWTLKTLPPGTPPILAPSRSAN